MSGSICRKVGFGWISIMVLLVGGLVQYGLALLTTQVSSPEGKILMRIVNPLFVVIWSQFLIFIIVNLTEKERN